MLESTIIDVATWNDGGMFDITCRYLKSAEARCKGLTGLQVTLSMPDMSGNDVTIAVFEEWYEMGTRTPSLDLVCKHLAHIANRRTRTAISNACAGTIDIMPLHYTAQQAVFTVVKECLAHFQEVYL